MTQPSEQELLTRVRRGDQAALGHLLQMYQRRLYTVCLRMVGHRDDAAEATQDAMLKIVQHIHEFRGESELATWMIRIVMNQAMSQLRRRRVRRSISLDAAGDGHDPQDQAAALRQQLADSREPAPDQRIQQEEARQRVHEALARLEEPLRAVLVLRDVEQMDYQQIAQVLMMPVGTVKSRLFRARLALRHELREPSTQEETASDTARPTRSQVSP
ncbi:MAG TPA: sigma-70 family RNA polymerase sigma factor [Phycisphaeraceae bacterium]